MNSRPAWTPEKNQAQEEPGVVGPSGSRGRQSSELQVLSATTARALRPCFRKGEEDMVGATEIRQSADGAAKGPSGTHNEPLAFLAHQK